MEQEKEYAESGSPQRDACKQRIEETTVSSIFDPEVKELSPAPAWMKDKRRKMGYRHTPIIDADELQQDPMNLMMLARVNPGFSLAKIRCELRAVQGMLDGGFVDTDKLICSVRRMWAYSGGLP